MTEAIISIWTVGTTLTVIGVLSFMLPTIVGNEGSILRGFVLALLVAGAAACAWPFIALLLAYERWLEPQA